MGEGLAVWMEQRLLRRWSGTAALGDAERDRAMTLRDTLDRALAADAARRAEERSATHLPEALPPWRDWTWRPDPWRVPLRPAARPAKGPETALGTGCRLFHDCPLGEVAALQVPGRAAPFALRLETWHFRGTYLSLAIDLPDAAAAGLRLRHILRVDADLETERPGPVFARLNLGLGSDPVQAVRRLDPGPAATADFDIAGLRVDPAQVHRLWVDLIFDSPGLNAVRLNDVVLSRSLRAEF